MIFSIKNTNTRKKTITTFLHVVMGSRESPEQIVKKVKPSAKRPLCPLSQVPCSQSQCAPDQRGHVATGEPPWRYGELLVWSYLKHFGVGHNAREFYQLATCTLTRRQQRQQCTAVQTVEPRPQAAEWHHMSTVEKCVVYLFIFFMLNYMPFPLWSMQRGKRVDGCDGGGSGGGGGRVKPVFRSWSC